MKGRRWLRITGLFLPVLVAQLRNCCVCWLLAKEALLAPYMANV